MATRTTAEQSIHDKMVQQQVNSYRNEKYRNIKADHIGHPAGAPNTYNGRTPDLTANTPEGVFVICEVETENTIDLQETIDQVKAFERVADQYKGELHMVVPEAIYEDALQVMDENDIEVFQWWTVRFR